MSYVKVTPDEFSIALGDMFNDLSEDMQKIANEAVEKSGRKGAKVLRTVSPVSNLSTSGKYRKSWSCTIERSRFSTKAVVFNKIPGLPHLLENGHVVANQYGRTNVYTKAQPHIDKGIKASEELLMNLLEKGISKL
jgi:hypothetical protein